MQETQETQVPSLGWEDFLKKETGSPLQYSCLGNPADRGAWRATVHEVVKEPDRTEGLALSLLFFSHFSPSPRRKSL